MKGKQMGGKKLDNHGVKPQNKIKKNKNLKNNGNRSHSIHPKDVHDEKKNKINERKFEESYQMVEEEEDIALENSEHEDDVDRSQEQKYNPARDEEVKMYNKGKAEEENEE